MDKKKIMFMIIIFVLVIILIIISLILINLIKKQSSTDYNPNTEFEAKDLYTPNQSIEKLNNRNKYYAIKDIINMYIDNINQLNNDELDDEDVKSVILEASYYMLDKSYINEFNITLGNIENKINLYKKDEKVRINEVYTLEESSSINFYIVYAHAVNSNQDLNLIIKTDSKNSTFSVFLWDYMTKYNIDVNSNIKDLKIDANTIEENRYNKFQYRNITNEQMMSYYFEDLKYLILNNPNQLYNCLNEEYRNARFKNIDEFNQYVTNLKNNITKKTLEKYQVSSNDGYTQYVCIDQNGNYYIFRETSVMDYEVILDTYTIDLPEFTAKYNNATEEEKVLLNIQKIFEAINLADYRYVYNKLDATFKANNFKTQADFEKYVKEKLYANNKVSSGSCQKTGNVYIYSVNITDASNANKETIQQKIVMQLKEGTDFVMSFSIE